LRPLIYSRPTTAMSNLRNAKRETAMGNLRKTN